MANGFMGKILRVNLTDRTISTIDTEQYADWGGGHGMGTKIFWDLCEDKTVPFTDPGNVVTIMTSPISGTLVPGAAGRTEVQGIGGTAYPNDIFTRSNFGGRFAGQLKWAGWDGIVVEGAADSPVWLDIRDGKVEIKSAETLWGLDTTEVQEEIWSEVTNDINQEWRSLGKLRDDGRTTARPAVLTIGRAGETQSRIAALIHDAGNGAGQGGFGGVFGSKNLKAISVIGSQSIEIADPKALMDARLWSMQYTAAGHMREEGFVPTGSGSNFGGNPGSGAQAFGPAELAGQPMGCLGCHRNCRVRWKGGASNGSSCVDYFFYHVYDSAKHGGYTQNILDATDALQRYGINAYQVEGALIWLTHLTTMGILGPGKEIDTTLDFSKLGEAEFAVELMDMICEKRDIGAQLHEGLARAAKAWGRYETDTASGILPIQAWGYAQHYDARTEVEWGYGTLIGDRDVNEHDFNTFVFWAPSIAALFGIEPGAPASKMPEIAERILSPYNDPMMLDYSDEGIYSEAMAKLVAWHRHYTRYYKQSMLFCDWCWGDFYNPYSEDLIGISGVGEPKFVNAVTGWDEDFLTGMEKGRRIWNLDKAIWVLQGRHRDQEVYTDQNYDQPALPGYSTYEAPYVMPVFNRETKEWEYKSVAGRMLDRDKVEDWKTLFFKIEGWDPATGWPTRTTLEGLDLADVADVLEAAGKLGAE